MPLLMSPKAAPSVAYPVGTGLPTDSTSTAPPASDSHVPGVAHAPRADTTSTANAARKTETSEDLRAGFIEYPFRKKLVPESTKRWTGATMRGSTKFFRKIHRDGRRSPSRGHTSGGRLATRSRKPRQL